MLAEKIIQYLNVEITERIDKSLFGWIKKKIIFIDFWILEVKKE